MSNDKYLITFVGGNDTKSENAAIGQCIKELTPRKVFAFLTPEIKDGEKYKFYESALYERHKDILEICEVDILNPTDSQVVYKTIRGRLEEIKDVILQEGGEGYVNLTSGTPTIREVFSLLLVGGKLPGFKAVYAPNPNPEYHSSFRLDDLSFYKANFAKSIMEKMIENYDFKLILEFLNQQECPLISLKNNADFRQLTKFCLYRLRSRSNEAKTAYRRSDYLKSVFPNWREPKKDRESILERYLSLPVLATANDNAQVVLWLGVIFEWAVRDMVKLVPGIVQDRDPDSDKLYRLPNTRDHLTFGEQLEIVCEHLEKKPLIAAALNALGKSGLRKARNRVAHEADERGYTPEWSKRISEHILTLVRHLNGGKEIVPFYERAKDELLRMCKEEV